MRAYSSPATADCQTLAGSGGLPSATLLSLGFGACDNVASVLPKHPIIQPHFF